MPESLNSQSEKSNTPIDNDLIEAFFSDNKSKNYSSTELNMLLSHLSA